MRSSDREEEPARVRRERDLYLRLLELGARQELDPFLAEALGLIVEVTDASRGYLELFAEEAGGEEAAWRAAHGCSDEDVEEIRAKISRGIIAEAVSSGRTILTHSALLDPRFSARESVQIGRIEAVLCAPVGGEAASGVVYLQGREKPGPFGEDDRAAAELFARHLAPLADRLLLRRKVAGAGDATAELRRQYRLDAIVGRSEALAAALREAMHAARVDVNVLLTGDSGTGKSQLARAIHDNSPRAERPCVELNCAALPASLLEAELFGARAGSHSEAKRDLPGKVAAAEGGTLFLDEVGELPIESQAKLLQLLQSRQYYPLGATRPVSADIRLIAASNRDLDEAVRERSFREDLYYRLQVLPIRLPSLAQRRGDLPELARALCQRVCARNRLAALALSPAALRAIVAAEWPGNVRQLENTIEAAAIRASGDGVAAIEARHLGAAGREVGPEGEPLTYQEATRRFQRDFLEATLRETDWNVTETGRRLDLTRSHVYNLIRVFGLARKH